MWRTTTALALLAALSACTAGNEPIDEEPELPSPYIYDDEEPVEPAFDAASIEAAVETAISGLYTLSAAPVLAGYHTAMEGQDASCPSYYSNNNGTYWFDQCTSSAGSWYSGYGFYVHYDEFLDEASGYVITGEGLAGAAVVDTADGEHFDAAGTAYALTNVHSTEPIILWQSVLQGTFGWTGSEADGSWLQTGLSPDVVMYAYQYDTTARYAYVNGGVSGFEGEITAVSFDEVILYNALAGSPCEDEPYGTISVRGKEGAWYDVVFDGPHNERLWQYEPDQCDGCGHAYYRGEAIGEICPDLSGLLGWEGSPW